MSGDTLNQFDSEERNIINLTYKIDKAIKLKHIMPISYSDSLQYLQGKRILDTI